MIDTEENRSGEFLLIPWKSSDQRRCECMWRIIKEKGFSFTISARGIELPLSKGLSKRKAFQLLNAEVDRRAKRWRRKP